MRSHPVSGKCGFLMLAGMALEEEEEAAAGLVEEEEEDEEDGICVGWAAATSAALTLGSRRKKEEGRLALCKRPRSRPVLCGPPGAESGQRLRRTQPVWGCSGCITLQLALGCCGDTQTHGWGAGYYTLHQTHTPTHTNALKFHQNTAYFSRTQFVPNDFKIYFRPTQWMLNDLNTQWGKLLQ